MHYRILAIFNSEVAYVMSNLQQINP